MTTAQPTVSVVMRAPRGRERLRALLAPLLLDRATLEVLVDGSDAPGIGELGAVTDARVRPLGGDRRGWGAGADAARGEIVLWLDAGVFATEGLVSAHARQHRAAERRLVVGYAPIRVLHERQPGDFAPRLRSREYEERCEDYERDPAAVLNELWAGNVSLRRGDWVTLEPDRLRTDREFGHACRDAGLQGVFDRSLRALRLYEPSLSEFVAEAHLEAVESVNHARPGARRDLDGAASLALRGLVLLAGSAHLWRVQDVAARWLWDTERRLGARRRSA